MAARRVHRLRRRQQQQQQQEEKKRYRGAALVVIVVRRVYRTGPLTESQHRALAETSWPPSLCGYATCGLHSYYAH